MTKLENLFILEKEQVIYMNHLGDFQGFNNDLNYNSNQICDFIDQWIIYENELNKKIFLLSTEFSIL